MRGKCIMFQGTGSSVGKSLMVTALCRILKQDGYRVAPFKAQNMALNSFATREGLEMGRAQAVQAEACGIEPEVAMNPVLLKPSSSSQCQVIINGRVQSAMSAADYSRHRPELRATVAKAYRHLEDRFDIIVIEGAGSPAEINLREGDIVNMAMAEMADAPVLLVGDIDRGGVFASLLGTMLLLTDEEQQRVRGVIINKFRGDRRILEPGLPLLEDRIHVPVVGVMPWMQTEIDDEDSVTDRFCRTRSAAGDIEVAVIRLAYMSNFTDFTALALEPGVRLRYVDHPTDLDGADLVVIPGSKNTIGDLSSLRISGMDRAIVQHARQGKFVIGICGGYQMLARSLRDPDHLESSVSTCDGLGLLDMEVVFLPQKTTVQSAALILQTSGIMRGLDGTTVEGYEIHMGTNRFGPDAVPCIRLQRRGQTTIDAIDGICNQHGNVMGTYLHGFFDNTDMVRGMMNNIRKSRGIAAINTPLLSLAEFKEREYDRLASVARSSLNMELIYRILQGEA